MVIDKKTDTAWKAAEGGEQWLQLAFPMATTINEFKIQEDKSSSINHYVIQCYDDKATKWVTCFNGMHIRREFVAPIVSRRTRGVRLIVKSTKEGVPAITEFGAYNDTKAEVFNDPKGIAARHKVGQ